MALKTRGLLPLQVSTAMPFAGSGRYVAGIDPRRGRRVAHPTSPTGRWRWYQVSAAVTAPPMWTVPATDAPVRDYHTHSGTEACGQVAALARLSVKGPT
jgi:hypothetical protein